MDKRPLDRRRKRIEYLLNTAPSSMNDETLEARSHWAKYICVVVSGHIESSVREILAGYAIERSSPAIARYVAKQLHWFQNAQVEKITSLAGSFSPEWQSSLSDFIDEERKSAINSIIGNRHAIAHGEDSSITISDLQTWYKKADDVIEHLVSLCTD
jgi:hypothetical protein